MVKSITAEDAKAATRQRLGHLPEGVSMREIFIYLSTESNRFGVQFPIKTKKRVTVQISTDSTTVQ